MPDPRPSRRPDEPALPARVTMPLLTLITQQALDEDYQQAARRRSAELSGTEPDAEERDGGPMSAGTGRRSPHLVAGAVIAVFGILVSVAALQTSRNADVDDASRATLVDRVDRRRDLVIDEQTLIARLRDETGAAERGLVALTDQQQELEARVTRLQVRTGFVAVTGAGLRVTVDDAPEADPNQVVRDSDLALLVNGLWGAGAEAIAINGQRLTALSAIRNSGQPIEVNSVGVAPPYTVLAIGDRLTLEAAFFETSSGLAFDGLSRDYGFTYEMENEENLSLPAGPSRFLTLRSATRPSEPDENGENGSQVPREGRTPS